MNMQSEESGFYDVTGSEPRPISKAEALGLSEEELQMLIETHGEEQVARAAGLIETHGAQAVEAAMATVGGAAEPDGSDDDKGVEDAAEVDGDVPPAAATDETDEPEVETQPDDGEDANDKGLYGGSIEDAAKRIADARGLEVMGQRVRRELRAKLDDHQVASRGREIAELVGERDEVEEDKKSYVRRANERIKDLEERISALSKPVRDGADQVLVDCALLGDFRSNAVHVVRLDTGEDVETRAMTGPEREKLAQRPLPFGEGNARAAGDDGPVGHGDAECTSGGPPTLEQGYHPAAMRPDPAEVPGTGLVTTGCAEHSSFLGPHTMGGQRWACYVLEDGRRHAFVPWPEPEGIGDIEAVDAETSDEGAPDGEAAVLDAELGDGDPGGASLLS